MSERPRARVAGVRLSMLVHLYRVRLRSHAVQELLAGSGIAIGVALVLGVLVANTSLTSSAGALIDQVVGTARLQLTARSSDGFPQSLVKTAKRLPGVRTAAPVLRQSVAVVGPHGSDAVQILGVTPGVVGLGGLGTNQRQLASLRFGSGLMLPASVAAATGARAGDVVSVLARGAMHRVRVSAILGGSTVGALDTSPVAIALMPLAQRLTGRKGRVTEVLFEPLKGTDELLARELRALAAGRLDVVTADNELRLLEHAAKPNDQSTSLFAAISVMVGFLLAVNAMLLTVPERRRFVADLRMQGYDWRQILALLGFQAFVLGVVASVAGILLGDLLSHVFFHRIPAYLTTAFPIGSQEVLGTGMILLALACGVLATMLASLSPAFDLRPSRPTDAVFHDRSGNSETLSRRTATLLSLAGVGSVALITVMVLGAATLTIVGGVALALGMLCVIPYLFVAVSRALRWAGERVRSSALIVVVSELRAITTRSVALAGIAALAVYGSVAIGGARADLLHGLNVNFSEYLRTADVWVTTGGNDLTTNSFSDEGASAAIARVPGVQSVRSYQGGFLDYGSRRLWIIARPAGDRPLIPASQLLQGSLPHATRLLRGHGWAAISEDFADEHHLHVGSSFLLPTPSGAARFGVAATVTNLGWSPGAVILSASDYRRYWQTEDPSALEVTLQPGVSPPAARLAMLDALGHRPGLGIQTYAQRSAQYAADARQGLQALSEIATLLLVAAALAVASALSASIWQRRARLASLKIQGYGTGQLWRALLLESVIVLGVGCVVGALAGVYGHALAARWLRIATGFPAPFSLDLDRVALTLALLAAIALTVISVAGLAAARAPARTSLQE
ncbi:MAG TPA: FtsX-like permease family protein [Solirubrobacteraceae bacterium]|nr:FtsX-like permease family protein [Solirubrobacteraceae bacterium]